jgi:hypothetical protein
MVKVLLFNHGEVDYQVKEGDRVAQLVIERVSLVCFPFIQEPLLLFSADLLDRYIHPRSSRWRN